ncbi:small ribosomal subunit Rsm22 family protein [Thermoclostridium stercorarium]|jgi:ribosomal protein RSM22 (predicted rRNA methylase)|uniref:Ribosomal small subunit Rsm22 n=1 Tax=Thermoclostridium stercorarium subsp. leptospartum DSM 9219 TaxID=1346611 RepID=A0A1B1YJ24_THEST|nr:small ribosomal subunit Rsm22 family protein [Thermoclostridium stercorarium]ANX00753.1 ribosomal small subunit Rsm22 [Thermoclostridium stercorarium subsp. leptospartum DSM 9219]UZQ86369.1 small ribosomal subunit Rsm22 family protein [Thermoclostridium stercorarium]
MEIPQSLRSAVENLAESISHSKLLTDAQNISMRYRSERINGERLITSKTEALAYSASRMPATYGAVYTALESSMLTAGCVPKTLSDIGAGTGAASWAAASILDLEKVICIEKEKAMLDVGKELMKHGPEPLRSAEWINCDLASSGIPRADLVIAAYVLNEIPADKRKEIIHKLWSASDMMLLIVEPGTPAGYANIIEARRVLVESGAHIASPCTHENACPKEGNDWCHFTCRINRSRLHRQLKGGEAPFEDEKYSYICMVREKCDIRGMRVLRHPLVRSGYVELEVCTKEGIKNIKISKRGGEKYKRARKSSAGTLLPE